MKRPTRAAWKKALFSFEQAFNLLMSEPEVSDELRESLFRVHDALRLRAGGALIVDKVEGDE